MNEQTIDALNRIAAQLARIAAAIESSTQHAAQPDTFEDLEALPIGWALRDRDGDKWVKTDVTDDADGASLWRCSELGLRCSSKMLPYWLRPRRPIERIDES